MTPDTCALPFHCIVIALAFALVKTSFGLKPSCYIGANPGVVHGGVPLCCQFFTHCTATVTS